MTLIGMPEAARRAGMTPDGIRRALMGAGVSLTRINARAIAVDEADLAAFVQVRGSSPGRGRPPGAKNRPKEGPSQPKDAKCSGTAPEGDRKESSGREGDRE